MLEMSSPEAETDLIAVGVAEHRLAHLLRVGLPLHRLDTTLGDLSDEGVEGVNEEGLHGVASVFGVLLDDQLPTLGKLPHRFCVGCDKGRFRSE